MQSESKSFSQKNIYSHSNSTVNNKLFTYLNNHLNAILVSSGRLLRAPIATLMTLIVIGIALALPASLFLFLENMKHVSQPWENSSQITLYLKTNVSAAQTQNLLARLKNQSDIAQVKYISPQQGLTELQNQINLQNDIASLTTNPLPGVILVQPDNSLQSPQALNNLLQKLQLLPQIDLAQLDMQWVKRLTAMLDLGRHLIYALGFLLGVGVIFIVGNTIHLNLQKYQREIEIFKLVGATNSFIRRPFLYTGILYGLAGALFALFLIALLSFAIAIPVHKLANLYNSTFHLEGITFSLAITILVIGVSLGMIGAWLAIGKHLREI